MCMWGKLGFLAFRLLTRVRSRARDRARVRLVLLRFKVVKFCKYGLEKVLSVDCINNLPRDDCYLHVS